MTLVAARLLRSWVRIPPGAWICVCRECRVLSGRGLCDELITRPEESYPLWCVVVCDLETSRIGAPYIYIYDISSLRVKQPVRTAQYSRIIFTESLSLWANLTNLTVLLLQLGDCSCNASSRTVARLPFFMKKHTEICGRDFVHFPNILHRLRPTNIICSWNWKL